MVCSTPYESGKDGCVIIDGYEIPITEWEIAEEGDEIDAANTKTGDDVVTGTTIKRATFTALWERTNFPGNSPPNLSVGECVAAEFCLGDATKKITGELKVLNRTFNSGVRSIVQYSIGGRFIGTVVYPT